MILTIDCSPHCPECLANLVYKVARLVAKGYSSGIGNPPGVDWTTTGEYPPDKAFDEEDGPFPLGITAENP